MILKLRKKPIDVDGLHYDGTNIEELRQFLGQDLIQGEAGSPFIRTREGDMLVTPGSIVVRGCEGEHYAVKPAIFQKTFDVVEGSIDSYGTEAHLTAQERRDAPDSMWGMPRLKKLRLDSKTRVVLAWDMIDRVKGANDEDRASARRRILAAAKRFGVDTSDWNKGKKALEAFQTANVVDPNFRMDAIPYLINQLTEEASELSQAACKAQRFGIDGIDPFQNVSNRDKVREEYTDVLVMMRLVDEELIARGYAGLLTGAGGAYFQERLAKRVDTLKKEYAEGRFTLPGEFADQQ